MRISPINLVSVRNQSKIKQNFNVNNNVSSNLSVDKFEKNVSFGDKFNPNDYWIDKEHHMADDDKIMKKIHFIEENITKESAEAIEKEFEKNGETVDDIYLKLNKDCVVWFEKKGSEDIPHHVSEYQEKFDLADLFLEQREGNIQSGQILGCAFPSYVYYLMHEKASNGYPQYADIHTALINDYSHAEDIGDYIRKCDIEDLLDEYRPVEAIIPKEKYRIKPSRILLPQLLVAEYTVKKAKDLGKRYIEDGYFVLQLAKEREVSQKKYDKLKQDLCDRYNEGLSYYGIDTLEELAAKPDEENKYIIENFIESHCDPDKYDCSKMKFVSDYDIERQKCMDELINPSIRKALANDETISQLSKELRKMDLKAGELASAVLDEKRYREVHYQDPSYDPQWDPHYWGD